MNKSDQAYKTIGEVAKILNLKNKSGQKLPTHTIRFWEKEFNELNPKKNNKGTRRYSSIDIEKLQIIHHLVKEKGYTLDGARDQLKILNKKFEVIKKLEKIKTSLLNIKNEL